MSEGDHRSVRRLIPVIRFQASSLPRRSPGRCIGLTKVSNRSVLKPLQECRSTHSLHFRAPSIMALSYVKSTSNRIAKLLLIFSSLQLTANDIERQMRTAIWPLRTPESIVAILPAVNEVSLSTCRTLIHAANQIAAQTLMRPDVSTNR